MAIIENNITKSLMRPLRMDNTIMPKINQEIPKVKGGAYENESGQARQDKDGRHRQTHRRSPLLGEPQMTLPNACAGSRRMESTKQPRISARLCFYTPYSFRRRFYLVRQRPKAGPGARRTPYAPPRLSRPAQRFPAGAEFTPLLRRIFAPARRRTFRDRP